MKFIDYLFNGLGAKIIIAFNGIAILFVLYWITFQNDWERDALITFGLVLFADLSFVIGNYVYWRKNVK
jgi:hypothetical protein